MRVEFRGGPRHGTVEDIPAVLVSTSVVEVLMPEELSPEQRWLEGADLPLELRAGRYMAAGGRKIFETLHGEHGRSLLFWTGWAGNDTVLPAIVHSRTAYDPDEDRDEVTALTVHRMHEHASIKGLEVDPVTLRIIHSDEDREQFGRLSVLVKAIAFDARPWHR